MKTNSTQLRVRSHVARDLLQTAAPFRDPEKAVWEYVANGLQYVNPGTHPVVRIMVEPRRIRIEDNGRGMDYAGLSNYFVMHGVNADRQAGRPGRGRYGTGKCAAFGIANVLRIKTVRDGRQSCVELVRRDINTRQNDPQGEEVPVTTIQCEEPTDNPNGTIVEIGQIQLPRIDPARIKRYIESHLARWNRNARVTVNNELCAVVEPTVASEHSFRAGDSELDLAEDACRLLGNAQLIVKVSKDWLEEERRGISIYSKGIWHETRRDRAGAHAKVFGEIELPQLEDDDSPISPFDATRSMQLNGNHPLVRAAYEFIDTAVRHVRKKLEEEDRARRTSNESRQLARQAEHIATTVNEHFRSIRHRLPKTASLGSSGADTAAGVRSQQGSQTGIVAGDNIHAVVAEEVASECSRTTCPGTATEQSRPIPPPMLASDLGALSGQRKDDQRPATIRGGGFQVRFAELGESTRRAMFDLDKREIAINLDHPQLAALRGSGVESQTFRRLAYEIALCEYAIGSTRERARFESCYLDPADAIEDLAATLDSVSRATPPSD